MLLIVPALDIATPCSQFANLMMEGYKSGEQTNLTQVEDPVSEHNSLNTDSSQRPTGIILAVQGILVTRRTIICIAFLSVFSLLFGLLALSAPFLEWDMLPYVANATANLTELSAKDIHELVYKQLQLAVPAEDYQRLTGSESRAALAINHEAFRQTSEFFYDARVVYIGLLSALMHLGMEPFFASYFISTVCIIMCIFLLANLLPGALPYGVCFSLPFIAFSCGLFELARFSTPDALAALVTVALYWSLMRKGWYLLLLLPASVFIRTDLIILAAIFHAYLFLTERFPRILVLTSGLATIAAYLLLNNYIVDGDPWSSLIGYNFGDKPIYPLDYTFTVSFKNYVSYILDGLRTFSYEPRFFMFGFMVSSGLFMFSARFFYYPNERLSASHQNMLFILVSSIVYIGAHFMLFPVSWIRFFAAQYALVVVSVLWAAMILLAQRNYNIDGQGEIFKI